MKDDAASRDEESDACFSSAKDEKKKCKCDLVPAQLLFSTSRASTLGLSSQETDLICIIISRLARRLFDFDTPLAIAGI